MSRRGSPDGESVSSVQPRQTRRCVEGSSTSITSRPFATFRAVARVGPVQPVPMPTPEPEKTVP